jgi:hypothetical protein
LDHIPPPPGEGNQRSWWRGTIGDTPTLNRTQHLPCPSTILRVVPLPETSSGRIIRDSLSSKILPQLVWGRWQREALTEGYIRLNHTQRLPCPSTMLRMVPLLLRNAFGSPVPGRIWCKSLTSETRQNVPPL